jgi:hypothetical protein
MAVRVQGGNGSHSPVLPVEHLGAAKLLFVVVGAGFVRGVAGVKPAQAGFAAVLDLQQHREDAEAAFGELRLKEP